MRRFLIALFSLTVMFSACSKKGVQSSASAEPWPEFSKEEVWLLTQIRQQPVKYADGQEHVTMQLNPEAGTFNGFAGCNRYFGQYQATQQSRKLKDSQQEVRGLTFSNAGATKMLCPDNEMKLEDKFLPCLSKVTDYDLTRYTLIFYQGDREVLRFEKQ